MQSKAVTMVVVMMLIASLACSIPGGIIETLAPGGTWYVTTSGNDSNDCLSVARACLTVPAAVAKVATGGVIEIGAGRFLLEPPRGPGIGLDLTGKVLTLRGTLTGDTLATVLAGVTTNQSLRVNGSGIIILENLIIRGGGARGGAALSLVARSPSATGATLRNVTIAGSAGHAIRVSGSVALQLEGVRLLNNQNLAIDSGDAQVDIHGSTISGNGGGIYAAGGEVTIVETTISGNGTDWGAQVLNLGAQMRIERSTISASLSSPGCSACTGVGILNEGELTMINSTVAGNLGTGIVNDGGLQMAYSTVGANGGSGLDIRGGSIALAEDIIENNSANDCTAVRGSPITVAWYYVNLSDGTCGTSLLILPSRGAPDPYLGSLAYNGGPTQTMALLFGSLAINAHDDGLHRPPSYDPWLRPPPTDQRGMPRPGPDGGIADVGAYEYQGASFPLIIATPGAATPTPGPLILILDRNANCRSGPGTAYESVDAYPAGQSLQVDGRTEALPWWWQVQVPNSKKRCWISSVAGVPPGDFNLLPVVPVEPPLPSDGVVDVDNDGDGYPASTDCNDKNDKIHPGAAETADDKVDSNCNGDDDT